MNRLPIIYNYKYQLKVCHISIQDFLQLQEGFTRRGNLRIYRQGKSVATVFFPRNEVAHLNITGIQSPGHLKTFLEHFVQKCPSKFRFDDSTLIIDNICASGVAGTNSNLNLSHVNQMFRNKGYKTQYQPTNFPAIIVKVPHGTVLVFKSSKLTLIGFKSVQELYAEFHSIGLCLVANT